MDPAAWMDVADLTRLCYSKERKHTSWILLVSLGVTGHLLNSLQETASSFHLLLISSVNFVNPFGRYTGSTRNYLSRQSCRGRGGIKQFYLAQSPSGGGATKQPGALACIPRERGSSQPMHSSAFHRQSRA